MAPRLTSHLRSIEYFSRKAVREVVEFGSCAFLLFQPKRHVRGVMMCEKSFPSAERAETAVFPSHAGVALGPQDFVWLPDESSSLTVNVFELITLVILCITETC